MDLGFQPMAQLGGGGDFERWGLVEGCQVSGGVSLKGMMGPCPFLSLSFLLSGHEVNSSPPHAPAIMYYATTGPNQQAQVTVD